MIIELSNRVVYDDFVSKMFLTSEEKEVLRHMLNKDSIIKTSLALNISERSVSRIKQSIEKKYASYRTTQLAILSLFLT